MADPLYIDAVGGSPEYTAQEVRLASGGMYAKGVANPFSARPGVIPNSNNPLATNSGMVITVADLNCVIAPDLQVDQGPYRSEERRVGNERRRRWVPGQQVNE